MEKVEGEYLWTEMYRPQKLADVIIPQSIKETFMGYVRDGQIANMLLTSASPGTGKTTTALALCHELQTRPLFINASMRNSISDIRNDVLQYATTVSLFGNATKIVILDEAERLSNEAQDSLKGLIEEVSKNCRFILTANTASRIIPALRSRCPTIEFAFTAEEMKAVSAQMYKRSCQILDDQGVVYNKAVIANLVKKFMPDNRELLNRLQEYSTAKKVIDEGILGQLAAADVDSLFDAMKAKKYDLVKQWCFDNQSKLTDDFYQKFFIKAEAKIEKASTPELVIIIDEYQRFHHTVPDRYIHFLALMTHVMMRVTFNA